MKQPQHKSKRGWKLNSEAHLQHVWCSQSEQLHSCFAFPLIWMEKHHQNIMSLFESNFIQTRNLSPKLCYIFVVLEPVQMLMMDQQGAPSHLLAWCLQCLKVINSDSVKYLNTKKCLKKHLTSCPQIWYTQLQRYFTPGLACAVRSTWHQSDCPFVRSQSSLFLCALVLRPPIGPTCGQFCQNNRRSNQSAVLVTHLYSIYSNIITMRDFMAEPDPSVLNHRQCRQRLTLTVNLNSLGSKVRAPWILAAASKSEGSGRWRWRFPQCQCDTLHLLHAAVTQVSTHLNKCIFY